MSIGSITLGTRKCRLVGGGKSNKTVIQISFRVTKKYRLRLLMDDMPFGDYQWTVNKRFKYDKSTKSKEEIDTTLWIEVPSDGRNHDIALKDVNSLDQSPSTSVLSTGCSGGVVPTVESMVENPATGEKRYTISLYHAGSVNKTLTGFILLNGKVVGPGCVLKPRQKAYRDVVIPATGTKHRVTAGYAYGKTKVFRTLWLIVDANPAPVIDPGQWNSQTTFNPGETVVIGSAVGETPLETDGSEWIFLEYTTASGSLWAPMGDDGLVEPDDDGTWAYQIETGSGTTFPANTSWKVRARRYKDYRESSVVEHTFTIGSTPGNSANPLTPPTITAPANKAAKSGSRITLTGTGPPGARLTFDGALETAWGTRGSLPRSVTVPKSGKWRTTVSTTYVDNNKKTRHSYKRVSYWCKATLNGRSSGWSNQVAIRWNRKK